jgi:predicted aminopeptidase
VRRDETRKQTIDRIEREYTSVKEHDLGGESIYTVWLSVLNQHFQAHPEPFSDRQEAELFRAMLSSALYIFLAMESPA